MGYTASDAIERITLKAWTSTSRGLTDGQLLELLDDSLRSDIVPFLKEVREEWFVTGTESVSPDSNGRISMPNSIASTIRTIEWMNNGQPIPLSRIEPEAAWAYEGQGTGSGVPSGFSLRGYGIQIFPPTVGGITVRIRFMERPPSMVLEEDAGLIASHASLALTLEDVPLAWQSTTPTAVDLISSESPFETIASAAVASLSGSVLTLTGIDDALIEDGFWVADVDASPFPAIPIEFHPLLQLDVMRTIYEGTGDKRLEGISRRQDKMEKRLRKTLAPRTQGSARPIVNPTAPGMGSGYRRGW